MVDKPAAGARLRVNLCLQCSVCVAFLLHVHSRWADTNTLMTNSGGGGAAETQTNEVSESNREEAKVAADGDGGSAQCEYLHIYADLTSVQNNFNYHFLYF